ncbi:MAG: hypothetical protein A2445_03830 [Candidatus Jacksonbacteria bacterium RIFOXYC2_FULL_44_29]|nr:MAG: hypothetical protein A2240_03865 [Candidatus Jacksonbacteria bacterium RIFOXYA2_FULL_43_12]OGY77059.1 MAG: hypothetical protein A2295_06145 [Candidatus Jacksonbacteria bacterium RIFOXYB2_FULL_44_15]OGY78238.1 MAG: hypothetical protein A2550_03575 [Candidatus Jacksonbacteria bacterium RIFOXYD2_FULL_43_21]OGY79898.1 MAG: hypothetical protein A2445_03830 [Candidatus Jacksonbacteria bacterium RIFOXYC2_FULL_44_29]HCC49683.1 hypothetical protein [Candidatus Jacksonbacteria bacterium]
MISLFYVTGSVIFFGTIIVVETDFFQRSSYVLGDIFRANSILGWLGILALVFLGALALGALIAVLYNALAAAGKGLKMEIEMIEEKH